MVLKKCYANEKSYNEFYLTACAKINSKWVHSNAKE
jgi:hypothetical protein